MNNFITTDLGGLPLRLNDLRFMQDAWRQGFNGIAKMFGVEDSKYFCLSSPTISGLSYSEFYACYEGEIWRSAATTVPSPAPGYFTYAVFTVGFDPTGDKVFADSTAHQTYQTRSITLANLQPSDVIPFERVLLSDLLERNLAVITSNFRKNQVTTLTPIVNNQVIELVAKSKYIRLENNNKPNNVRIRTISNPYGLDSITITSSDNFSAGFTGKIQVLSSNIALVNTTDNIFFAQVDNPNANNSDDDIGGAGNYRSLNVSENLYTHIKLDWDYETSRWFGTMVRNQIQGLG